MPSASVSSPPASTGSRRRCLSISPASGGLLPFAVFGLPAFLALFSAAVLGADRLRRAPAAAGAGGADLPVRGSVERGRMAARPCPDRVSVEPGRLCLGRRFPGGARDAAEHRLDRDLRAEFPDRAGGLAAGAARRHVADADAAGAPRRAGGRRRAARPGACFGRRDPARACCRRGRPIPGCAWCSRRCRRGSNGTRPPPRPISAV